MHICSEKKGSTLLFINSEKQHLEEYFFCNKPIQKLFESKLTVKDIKSAFEGGLCLRVAYSLTCQETQVTHSLVCILNVMAQPCHLLILQLNLLYHFLQIALPWTSPCQNWPMLVESRRQSSLSIRLLIRSKVTVTLIQITSIKILSCQIHSATVQSFNVWGGVEESVWRSVNLYKQRKLCPAEGSVLFPR